MVFVYYAGHGLLKNLTKVLCNNSEGKFTYPLEKELKALGDKEGAYVVGFFDCSRSVKNGVDPESSDGSAQSQIDSIFEGKAGSNTFLTFGCAPYIQTWDRKSIAIEYFQKMKEIKDQY